MADKSDDKKAMMLDIRKQKSRIPMPGEIKKMNEKIKKKRKSGDKDIFDYIGDIIKTPYIIRGGEAKGGRVGLAHGSKRPKGGWKD